MASPHIPALTDRIIALGRDTESLAAAERDQELYNAYACLAFLAALLLSGQSHITSEVLQALANQYAPARLTAWQGSEGVH